MMLVTVEGEEKMKALVEEGAGEKVMAEDQEEGGGGFTQRGKKMGFNGHYSHVLKPQKIGN